MPDEPTPDLSRADADEEPAMDEQSPDGESQPEPGTRPRRRRYQRKDVIAEE
jgi:hypothetical protein